MVVTVAASWLVGSKGERQRRWAFGLFLLSNAVWAVWSVHASAWALLTLQCCLAAMNIRGAVKNRREAAQG